jgi:hypothetical protein
VRERVRVSERELIFECEGICARMHDSLPSLFLAFLLVRSIPV